MKNSKQSTGTASKPASNPNWPSKNQGQPSGTGRGNNAPSPKK